MTDLHTHGSFRTWSTLLQEFSRTDSPSRQAYLLGQWLQDATMEDRFCAIQLVAGDLPKKLLTKKALASLHAERSPLPAWLQEECYAAAPDPCEAIALMEDADHRHSIVMLHDMVTTLRDAARYDQEQKSSIILQHWDILDQESLYLFNRLATGNFTSPIPRSVWIPAVASLLHMDAHALVYRLEQKAWSKEGLLALAAPLPEAAPLPLPFPSTGDMAEDMATEIHAYSMTWLHAGKEVQLVKRNGKVMFWGRGLDDRFDDLAELLGQADRLPDDTILYGLLLSGGSPDNLTRFHVLDVWHWQGSIPEGDGPARRREMIRELTGAQKDTPFRIAEELVAGDVSEWRSLHRKCRVHQAQGIMLLPKEMPGNRSGSILYWPAAPHRLKAVLLYVQRGDGSQGPQYSFGLAKGRDWVTVARTGEGLNEAERDALDAFTKANTLQRFGPVRTVKAVQVMELEVDTIRASTRHKSGYLLEGVRIAAWRKDLGTEMVDDLVILNSMRDE